MEYSSADLDKINAPEWRGEVKQRAPDKDITPISCGSNKAHSRHLADLPWDGVAVKLILSAGRFFCLKPDCRREIFCERLPGLAAPYAHKTVRPNELLTRLGVSVSLPETKFHTLRTTRISAGHNCPGRASSLGRQDVAPGQWGIPTDRPSALPSRFARHRKLSSLAYDFS
jgi:hypothetical protein